MTTARDQLSKANILTIAAIEAGVLALSEARNLIDRFQRMIRRKAKAELDPWIADARHSLFAPFATGYSKIRQPCPQQSPNLGQTVTLKDRSPNWSSSKGKCTGAQSWTCSRRG